MKNKMNLGLKKYFKITSVLLAVSISDDNFERFKFRLQSVEKVNKRFHKCWFLCFVFTKGVFNTRSV